MKNKLWLIGAGYMASEYVKVLKALNVDFSVIGRGKDSSLQFSDNHGVEVISGGIDTFLETRSVLTDHAIVAVSVDELFSTTLKLIELKIRNILVEKPAGLSLNEIEILCNYANLNDTNIFVAYNRRHYASVKLLKEFVIEDGGIKSINFEFTEWVHTIDFKKFPTEVLQKFLIANSTHVIDAVFHLAGKPKILESIVTGSNLPWHTAGSIFMGIGVTELGIPFSYSSNWEAPGRWVIEVLTSKRRFYLKPLEKLFFQDKGQVVINELLADYSNDEEFKPGVFNMISDFLQGNSDVLCTIKEHCENFSYYEKIGGYK